MIVTFEDVEFIKEEAQMFVPAFIVCSVVMRIFTGRWAFDSALVGALAGTVWRTYQYSKRRGRRHPRKINLEEWR